MKLCSRLQGRGPAQVAWLLVVFLLAWSLLIVQHLVRWGSLRRGFVAFAALAMAVVASVLLRRFGRALDQLISPRLGMVLFGALAVAITAMRLFLVQGYSVPQTSDFGDYRRLGHDLSTGKGYQSGRNNGLTPGRSWRPPGYPLLLAAAYKASGQSEIGAGVLDALLGVVLCCAAGALAWQMAGPTAGVLALAVVGFSPLTLILTLTSSSEAAFGAFLFAGLAATVAAENRRRCSIVPTATVAGLTIGYACLIRPPGLLSAAVGLTWLAGMGRAPRAWLVACLLFVTGASAAILPWTVRNYMVLGKPLLISSNGGEVFYSANVVSSAALGGAYMPENYRRLRSLVPDEVKRNTLGFVYGVQYIAEHPWIFVASLPHRYACMLEAHDCWVDSGQRLPVPTEALQALASFAFWFIPFFGLINMRDLARLVTVSRPALLLAGVYIAWMPVSALFEAFQRAQYPYLLLPLLLTIAAVKSRDGGALASE